MSSELAPPVRLPLPTRRSSWRLPAAAVLCIAALIAVEAALIAPGHLLAGDIADGALVVVLLSLTASAGAEAATSRDDQALRAIRALVLVPLARVVGVGLPLHEGSYALDTLVVAVLMGFAAIRIAAPVGVSLRSLAQMRLPNVQAGAAAAGLALGFVAFELGARRLWPEGADGGRVLVALVAAIAVAVVEEVIFRGVVQVSLQRALGRAGLIGATLLFTATYLGLSTAALVMVVALAGLVFALSVRTSGSLTGAIAGHVLLVLSAGWLWPAALGRHHTTSVGDEPATTIGLGFALLGAAAIVIYGDRRAEPARARPGVAFVRRWWRLRLLQARLGWHLGKYSYRKKRWRAWKRTGDTAHHWAARHRAGHDAQAALVNERQISRAREETRKWAELIRPELDEVVNYRATIAALKPKQPPNYYSDMEVWIARQHPELHASIRAVAAIMLTKFPALYIATSGDSHATHTYHRLERAVDLGARSQQVREEAGQWCSENLAGRLVEGIHNPTLSVKYGEHVGSWYWGDQTWGRHRDHLHLAA